ncbi:MAG: hypothetical protein HC921_13445 [Synechococcaceae cyanobacterium SM2_3_1]|nr:hypothetical protein [Synechococcaceae cyanobacterium SM2_3_1]
MAAVVVPTDPSLDPTQLEASLRSSLVTYKLPKRWLFLQEIPRNPQGKVSRLELQQAFFEDLNGYSR